MAEGAGAGLPHPLLPDIGQEWNDVSIAKRPHVPAVTVEG